MIARYKSMSVCLNLKSVCKKTILVQSIRPPKQAFNGYNLLTNSGYSKRKSEVDFVRQGCIVSCNSATIYILSNEWEVGCDAEVEKQNAKSLAENARLFAFCYRSTFPLFLSVSVSFFCSNTNCKVFRQAPLQTLI